MNKNKTLIVILILLFSSNSIGQNSLQKIRKDRPIDNGCYAEMMIGLSIINNVSTNKSHLLNEKSPIKSFHDYSTQRVRPTIGMKTGYKYYFGNHEKYRIGMDIVFLRAAVGMELSSSYLFFGIDAVGAFVAPLNIGLSNVVKLNNLQSFEFSFGGGYGYFYDYASHSGIIYSDVNFKIKRILTIGLNYTRILPGINNNGIRTYATNDVISFKFGIKF
jgi:hypothetical protein